jgi:hypothetical protein
MHIDSTNNPVFINEQIHKNAQATTVLIASISRDEYNKVSGLDNAKQIWDTLKISHEGNDTTMITKMELVESELGSRVENGRKKSRPDPYRFLYLTRPFPYLWKNMETGRKRERAYSVRFCGIPFFSGLNPYLFRI